MTSKSCGGEILRPSSRGNTIFLRGSKLAGAAPAFPLMQILVFNPGSNSLKFALVDEPGGTVRIRGVKKISGTIEPIGRDGALTMEGQSERMPVADYGEAAIAIADRIEREVGAPKTVACRVVHGGTRFTHPVRVDGDILKGIEDLEGLAPLHNKASVEIIRAVQKRYGDSVAIIAVWDNAFHQTIPREAHLYAIPLDVARHYGVRRYGFHGISHRYLMLRCSELENRPLDELRLITLHLEGGSSACAISRGASIDTSMGFTPLEGLVMSTRCGDIDASVIPFLTKKLSMSPDELEQWLNKKCGLLGISGISGDTRVLVKEAATSDAARCALDVFSYRVRKYIGAYLAVLNGADAIVFGGGIGENTPLVREKSCASLENLGIRLSDQRNKAIIDREGLISSDDSSVRIYVIPSEEELMIAQEAAPRA